MLRRGKNRHDQSNAVIDREKWKSGDRDVNDSCIAIRKIDRDKSKRQEVLVKLPPADRK